MLNLSVKEKIFLLLLFIALVMSVSEYVYMNNNSLRAKREETYDVLLDTGMTLEQIKVKLASEPKQVDGIFSPFLQLWLTGVVIGVGGIWFCMLMLLNERDEVRTSYVMLGSIFLFWVIAFEVILFLWKILR